MDDITAIWVFFALFFAFMSGVIYSNKGGNWGWGWLAGLVFGIFGLLFVLVSNPGPKCPHCRSTYPKGASVCRSCQREIAGAGATVTTTT